MCWTTTSGQPSGQAGNPEAEVVDAGQWVLDTCGVSRSTSGPWQVMANTESSVDEGHRYARSVRLVVANSDNELGAYLRTRFLPELRSEHDTVRGALDSLGTGPSLTRGAIVRVGELVARVKGNGKITSYSPSSRVLELEGLIAGVHAKRRVWATIDTLAKRYGVTGLPDVSGHIDAAEQQLACLERHHDAAIREAFGPGQVDSEDPLR